MILYKIFLGYFLVLKLFPGDPILDHPDIRDPLFKKIATEVSLLGGVAGKNAPYEAHSCDKDCQTSKPFLHPALARSTQAERAVHLTVVSERKFGRLGFHVLS